eukprot:14100156-Alexandrium_andersonii.AAC.1
MLARLCMRQSGNEATYILHPRFAQSHPEPPSACVGEVPAVLKLPREEQIQGLRAVRSCLPRSSWPRWARRAAQRQASWCSSGA